MQRFLKIIAELAPTGRIPDTEDSRPASWTLWPLKSQAAAMFVLGISWGVNFSALCLPTYFSLDILRCS